MDDTMANQGGGNTIMLREYRKGNWTVEETIILIEAKKMDDERRMKSERGKPTEQRWKWIEDYCWKKGCFRSQSQCNDKWDNLMRDFKKVREYERTSSVGLANDQGCSYWKIDKNLRKEKNLPSNMLSQIYEALVEVVVDKSGERALVIGGATSNVGVVYLEQQPQILPPKMQHATHNPTRVFLPLPIPPPQATPPSSQPLPTLDSDTTSEKSDSPAKRRRGRRRKGDQEGAGYGAGTSGMGNSHEVVSAAISRSATIMAEAINSREDREERRHRELLSLHERRLQIEESKAEINKQGINGMVNAINKLASSILALASNNQSTPK